MNTMAEKCSICLEEMVGDLGVAVPCGHCYHRDCFARLKADCALKRAKVQCCVCKRKVKKFHNIYLNVSQCCPVEASVEKKKTEKSIVEAKQENSKLKKRLQELQTLSNDQSDLLFRILPRYDKLESRCSYTKRENRHLHKQVEALKDENWELLFDNFETKSKLSRTEQRLEEADGENMDLHVIWDTLEDQLEKSSVEKKRAKKKAKKLEKDLEGAKRELITFKEGKKCLMIQSRDQVNHPNKALKRRRVSFDSG